MGRTTAAKDNSFVRFLAVSSLLSLILVFLLVRIGSTSSSASALSGEWHDLYETLTADLMNAVDAGKSYEEQIHWATKALVGRSHGRDDLCEKVQKSLAQCERELSQEHNLFNTLHKRAEEHGVDMTKALDLQLGM